MWIRECILALIGFSAGVIIASGLFAFITGLGIISNFADRTHTGSSILFYENCLIAGGIVGNLLFLYRPKLFVGGILLGIFGLGSGIFVGCWSMALAETGNVFPIFMRKVKIMESVTYLLVGMALGKVAGALLYFLNGW